MYKATVLAYDCNNSMTESTIHLNSVQDEQDAINQAKKIILRPVYVVIDMEEIVRV